MKEIKRFDFSKYTPEQVQTAVDEMVKIRREFVQEAIDYGFTENQAFFLWTKIDSLQKL